MTTENPASPTEELATVVGYTSTDIGMRREENQDSLGVIESAAFKFFLVADGMGGMRGGATASKLAVSVFESEIRTASELTASLISAAACAANNAIFNRSAEDPELNGMGTTLVGLGFSASKLFVLNVGDSRAYRARGGTLTQLTEDHTLVGELVRSGSISAAQAQSHPVSHMLTRSLGPSAEVEIDCIEYPEPPRAGDIYLLCSDGLYNMVGQAEILEVMNSFELSEVGPELISIANLRGGPDNITVIVISITGDAGQLSAIAEHNSDDPVSTPAPTTSSESSAPSAPSAAQLPPSPLLKEANSSATSAATIPTDAPSAHPEVSSSPPQGSFIHEYRYPFLFILLSGILTAIFAWPRRAPPPQPPPTTTEISIVAAPPLIAEPGLVAPSSAAAISSDPTSTPAAPTTSTGTPAPSQGQVQAAPVEGTAVTPPSAAAALFVQKSRPELLVERVAHLKGRLEAFDQPISGKSAQLLGESLAKVSELQNRKDALSFDLEKASAALTKWLDVKNRLNDKNQVDLASEIAPLSPEIQATLELFRRATWNYIQATDSTERDSSALEHDARLQQLAKNRSDTLATLGSQMTEISARKITESDTKIRELTLKRDELNAAINELQEEILFHRTLMSGDATAREQKRAEITAALSQAEGELTQLQQIPERDTAN